MDIGQRRASSHDDIDDEPLEEAEPGSGAGARLRERGRVRHRAPGLPVPARH